MKMLALRADHRALPAPMPVSIPRDPAVLFSGAVLFFAGLVVTLGWAGGLDILTRWMPGYSALVPSTGLSLMALATATICLTKHEPLNRLADGLALSAMVLSLSSFLVRQLAGLPGVDSLLFPETLGPDGTAFATTTLTLVAGYCVLAASQKFEPTGRVFEFLATAGLLIAASACIAYAFGAASLYSILFFTSMALPTAVGFSLLFLGLLSLRAEHTWMRFFVGPGSGSATARRMIPVLIIAPVCFIALELSLAGYVLPGFAYALITIALTVVATTSIAVNAHIENNAEMRAAALTEGLKQSNQEVQLLLAELHHRVKNNVQQINSIIAMELREIEDEDFRDKLSAISTRIRSIGSIHQLLMLSPTVKEVELLDFVEDLNKFIRRANALEDRNITLSESGTPIYISMDSAVTLGLLLAEVIMNSIKHAFTPEMGGEIRVCLTTRDDNLQVVIADNGKGTANAAPSKGLGSKIVIGLTRKLGGTFETASCNGMRTTIEVPLKKLEVKA